MFTRSRFQKKCLAVALVLTVVLLGAVSWAGAEQPEKRPNVLFIAIDDMNDWGRLHGRASGRQDAEYRLARRARRIIHQRPLSGADLWADAGVPLHRALSGDDRDLSANRRPRYSRFLLRHQSRHVPARLLREPRVQDDGSRKTVSPRRQGRRVSGVRGTVRGVGAEAEEAVPLRSEVVRQAGRNADRLGNLSGA